jgi:hypothetical protein
MQERKQGWHVANGKKVRQQAPVRDGGPSQKEAQQ